MEYAVLLVVLLVFLGVLALLKRPSGLRQRVTAATQRADGNWDAVTPQSKEVAISYCCVDSLVTPAERSFLAVLETAVNNRARIYCKVRVADVLKADALQGKSQRYKLFLKTSQKHFDLVLCDTLSLRPLCVIELNDKSHQRKSRQERDLFLTSACESAGLPIMFTPAKRSYLTSEIVKLVEPHLGPSAENVHYGST